MSRFSAYSYSKEDLFVLNVVPGSVGVMTLSPTSVPGEVAFRDLLKSPDGDTTSACDEAPLADESCSNFKDEFSCEGEESPRRRLSHSG